MTEELVSHIMGEHPFGVSALAFMPAVGTFSHLCLRAWPLTSHHKPLSCVHVARAREAYYEGWLTSFCYLVVQCFFHLTQHGLSS